MSNFFNNPKSSFCYIDIIILPYPNIFSSSKSSLLDSGSQPAYTVGDRKNNLSLILFKTGYYII